jgi:ornithine cyclodeaminase
VVLAASAREPVIERRWLAPGAHVDAVGASQPSSRELDAETMAACALFVDRRQSLEGEAGEWQDGVRRGLFGPDHVRAELGEVLAGLGGRSSPEEITLFRSLGLAVEDLAAAQAACERARAAGVGTVVEW